jgi:streptogramin lyase
MDVGLAHDGDRRCTRAERSDRHGDGLSDEELSGKTGARSSGDSRERGGIHQGMAGAYGRLDPKTGQVTEWASPGGPRSRPYGITAVGNILWYSESNTKPNTIVRFDPKTEKFQTWTIASGGGVVRNMVPTPDGNLWLACSGVNGIAFVEVKNSAKVASQD